MKRIENKVANVIRNVKFDGGEIVRFYECAVCGRNLTKTYYICEDCIEKHFRHRVDVGNFIDYLKRHSISVGVDRVKIPNIMLLPSKWNMIRRNV